MEKYIIITEFGEQQDIRVEQNLVKTSTIFYSVGQNIFLILILVLNPRRNLSKI